MVESTQKIELRPELTANNEDINELQALKLELERIRSKMNMVENNLQRQVINITSPVVEKMNMVEKNLKTQMTVEMSSVAEKMNMVEKILIGISKLIVLNC